MSYINQRSRLTSRRSLHFEAIEDGHENTTSWIRQFVVVSWGQRRLCCSSWCLNCLLTFSGQVSPTATRVCVCVILIARLFCVVLFPTLQCLKVKGQRNVIGLSGMADGTDLLFAQVCVRDYRFLSKQKSLAGFFPVCVSLWHSYSSTPWTTHLLCVSCVVITILCLVSDFCLRWFPILLLLPLSSSCRPVLPFSVLLCVFPTIGVISLGSCAFLCCLLHLSTFGWFWVYFWLVLSLLLVGFEWVKILLYSTQKPRVELAEYCWWCVCWPEVVFKYPCAVWLLLLQLVSFQVCQDLKIPVRAVLANSKYAEQFPPDHPFQ